MNFSIEALELDGVFIVHARRFPDNRGYFLETWSRGPFGQLGLGIDFVQDNESLSLTAGTLRGLHFQRPPFEQGKLVRVVTGAVMDVVVDIRPQSNTFGRWCACTLTAASGDQLFAPRGFAHGFMTLEDDTVVTYKVDAPYSPAHEAGFRWNDPDLAIDWPLKFDRPIISDRDDQLPSFSRAVPRHLPSRARRAPSG